MLTYLMLSQGSGLLVADSVDPLQELMCSSYHCSSETCFLNTLYLGVSFAPLAQMEISSLLAEKKNPLTVVLGNIML